MNNDGTQALARQRFAGNKEAAVAFMRARGMPKRTIEIFEAVIDGSTFAEMAERYEISRSRAHALFQRAATFVLHHNDKGDF
jgi:hypothetical protein